MQSLSEMPDDYESLYEEAKIKYDQWCYEDAETIILLALSLDAERAEAHYLHGMILEKLRRYRDSISAMKRTLELEP